MIVDSSWDSEATNLVFHLIFPMVSDEVEHSFVRGGAYSVSEVDMPPKVRKLGAALAPKTSKVAIVPLEVQVPTLVLLLITPAPISLQPSLSSSSLIKKCKGKSPKMVPPKNKNGEGEQARLKPLLYLPPLSLGFELVVTERIVTTTDTDKDHNTYLALA